VGPWRCVLLAALAGCGARPDADDGVGETRASIVRGTSGTHGTDGAAIRSVLLITLDTTRADYLGCYDATRATSPHLDALAREGVLFELCLASSSVTPVSHASILTARNPYAHGLRVIHAPGGWRLPADVPTLAEALRDAGKRTGAFLSSFTVSEHFGLERGFDTWDNGLGEAASGKIAVGADGHAQWDTRRYQRRSDETTDRAIDWLRASADPFFLWVHYWDPHDLVLRPPDEVLHRFLPPGERGTRPLGKQPLETYEAEIFWVDAQIGRLLAALEESERAADTLVAVIGDHGEGLGEHDWMGHRLLYQEQMHLPLVLRWPGGPRERRVDALVRSIDLAPTVLELLGLPALPGGEGASLVALSRGADESPRLAYADQLNAWDTNGKIAVTRPQDDLLYVLMDRRWKLIHKPTQPHNSELYDLESDPDEAVNLYRVDHPEAVRLLAELDRRDAYVLEQFPPLEADGAADVEGALGALGYTDSDAGEDTGEQP